MAVILTAVPVETLQTEKLLHLQKRLSKRGEQMYKKTLNVKNISDLYISPQDQNKKTF